MPELRLLLLGIVAAVVVLALVAGSAFQVLRESFKQLRGAQDRDQAARRSPAAGAHPRNGRVAPQTPERTRLRWYSPEIVVVLLLAFAAGLWLAKLSG